MVFSCIRLNAIEEGQSKIERSLEDFRTEVRWRYDHYKEYAKIGLQLYSADRLGVLAHEVGHALSVADYEKFPPKIFFKKQSALKYKKSGIYVSPVPFLGDGFYKQTKKGLNDLLCRSKFPLLRASMCCAAGPIAGFLYYGMLLCYLDRVKDKKSETELGCFATFFVCGALTNIFNLLPILKDTDGRKIAHMCFTRLKLGRKEYKKQLQDFRKLIKKK